ncbi:hypothetical protein BCR44DRAFT_1436994 [Catenaria anguillulae PL171]|uniref:P-loop containing nucleoside triphosphate hydrolase protein n=1 Tax=Catenaria anguillulae PL171 TaxID=765915 RepID=A0A1Y2HLS3_9FUNG|nr:hypothetical protein BCR44DRAFT_1436994 [Catenaria anguillulae PL171]
MVPFCPSGRPLSLTAIDTPEIDVDVCFHMGVILPCISIVCLVALANRARFLACERPDLPLDMQAMGRGKYFAKLALSGLNFAIGVASLVTSIASSPWKGAIAVPFGSLFVLVPLGMAVCLHPLEHKRSRRSATSLSTFYTLFLLSLAVHLEPPEARTSFFGKLFFTWVWDLLHRGNQSVLKVTDLWRLPVNLGARLNCDRLAIAWDHERAKRPANPSLLKAIFRAFGVRYALIAVLAIMHAGINFLTPVFVEYFVEYLTLRGTEKARSREEGLVVAILFLVLNMIETVLFGQGFHNVFLEQVRIKAGLQNLVYRKGVRVPSIESVGGGQASSPVEVVDEDALGAKRIDTPTPDSGDGAGAGDGGVKSEILNLATVDTQSISNGIMSLAEMLTAPIAVVVAMYLLYRQVGWAMIVSLVMLLGFTPFMAYFADRMMHYRTLMLTQTDARIKTTTETLASIKTLKLYGWTRVMGDRILGFRNEELKHLKSMQWVMAWQIVLSFVMPTIATAGTLAVAALTSESNSLTSARLFVVLSVMRMLNQPLEALVWGWNPVVEAYVSQGRIRRFLLAKDLDVYVERVRDDDLPEEKGDGAGLSVHVSNAKFAFSGTTEVLDITDLRIERGTLTAVIGSVGAGKTALVQAILGEIVKLNADGRVRVFGPLGIAYVPQHPWVLNTTVKNNVLFGLPMDKEVYHQVIEACALGRDLDVLEKGDETLIGERGIALSGGQRARVSVARATYAALVGNMDLVIMDDPLSAVDAHVDRHMFNSVFHPKSGLLRRKTVLLVTHAIHHLSDVDRILLLDNGRIAEQGSYAQLMTLSGDQGRVAKMVYDYMSKRVSDSDSDVAADTVPAAADPDMSVTLLHGGSGDEDEIQIAGHRQDIILSGRNSPQDDTGAVADETVVNLDENPLLNSPSKATAAAADILRRRSRTVSVHSLADELDYYKDVDLLAAGADLDDEYGGDADANNHLEEKKTGSVSWRVYWQYIKYCGIGNVVFVVLTCFIGTAIGIVVTYWLAAWGSASDRGEDRTAYYLAIYVTIVLSNGLLNGVSIAYSMTVSAIQGARATMQSVLDRVLRAPMSFHSTTTSGKIINRFSSDQNRVDSEIPEIWDHGLWIFMHTAFVVVTILIAAPWFIVVLVPTSLVFFGIQKLYLNVSREVQRMSLILAAPVYSHFSETVSGLACVRAFGHVHRFSIEGEKKFDAASGGAYNLASVQRWLFVALQILGNVIVTAITLFAVLYPHVDSGYMSVALNYSFDITYLLSLAIRLYGQLENAIISVERLKEYSQLPSEADEETPLAAQLSPSWPQEGRIEFKNYSTRYREGLPLVLDGVNVVIEPGAKVGIVGRTGSGKSTLVMSAFRLIEGVSGSIEVDRVDVSTLGLHDLRTRLTVLPQDPVLFDATVRENLDPEHVHDDAALWSALDGAHLGHFIRDKLEAGLDSPLAPNSLSAGQAQLLCLARALLRKSKVLILDEASSSVDHATDEIVQSTIRREFAQCTVMTIAHRIGTIMDADKILVLDCGQVVEYDSPANLLANPESVFYTLAVESKLVGKSGEVIENESKSSHVDRQSPAHGQEDVMEATMVAAGEEV